MPRLDRRQAEDLIDSVEAWELNDDATRISRTFKFPKFVEAQALATRIADLAESQFHHPEITFGWGYCRVEFQTRKIRGLHENDFIMAAKVNEFDKGAMGTEQGEDRAKYPAHGLVPKPHNFGTP